MLMMLLQVRFKIFYNFVFLFQNCLLDIQILLIMLNNSGREKTSLLVRYKGGTFVSTVLILYNMLKIIYKFSLSVCALTS